MGDPAVVDMEEYAKDSKKENETQNEKKEQK